MLFLAEGPNSAGKIRRPRSAAYRVWFPFNPKFAVIEDRVVHPAPRPQAILQTHSYPGWHPRLAAAQRREHASTSDSLIERHTIHAIQGTACTITCEWFSAFRRCIAGSRWPYRFWSPFDGLLRPFIAWSCGLVGHLGLKHSVDSNRIGRRVGGRPGTGGPPDGPVKRIPSRGAMPGRARRRYWLKRCS